MLHSLKIENIAIIENAEIEFDAGLNILTGETGAGKSIIIDSINAILGERTSRELIRTGASQARVSAVFSNAGLSVNAKLIEYDIEPQQDGSLLLQRSINLDGRNVCRINGSPATVTMLKSIGGELINIHGQHDNQALLSPEGHYIFIDSVAENGVLLNSYKTAYSLLRSLEKELAAINMDETEKTRRLDLLNYQIDELESAGLKIGEQDELNVRKNLYQNAEKVIGRLREAYEALNGTEDLSGAKQQLEFSAGCLDSAAIYYAELEKAAETVRSMSYDIEEYIELIRGTLDMLDYNPKELELIEERLDTIYRLSRKYGATEEDMLIYLENAVSEREKINLSDERSAALQNEIRAAKSNLERLAVALTQSRIKAGEQFAKSVKNELDFLDMPGVVFVVERQPAEFSVTGADKIEFLISANAGEVPKPIAKIASGGELSRIMLAIKNVLSAKDDVNTLIFDEVDAGVSGRAAQKVAMKLRQVSKGRQVICVTHLAQIAAQADSHLLISKSVHDNKTYTQVDLLDQNGRKNELARIIGGLKVTELQLQSAEEMLMDANNILT
jgi:DNA repair protein RecN (Recombination protein N)